MELLGDVDIVVNPSVKISEHVLGVGADVMSMEDTFRAFRAFRAFRMGMIAMGCEIETHARLREDVRGIEVDDYINDTVAGALRATVQSVGIADEVDDMYQRLIEALAKGDGASGGKVTQDCGL